VISSLKADIMAQKDAMQQQIQVNGCESLLARREFAHLMLYFRPRCTTVCNNFEEGSRNILLKIEEERSDSRCTKPLVSDTCRLLLLPFSSRVPLRHRAGRRSQPRLVRNARTHSAHRQTRKGGWRQARRRKQRGRPHGAGRRSGLRGSDDSCLCWCRCCCLQWLRLSFKICFRSGGHLVEPC
jgi:hypothetical protein